MALTSINPRVNRGYPRGAPPREMLQMRAPGLANDADSLNWRVAQPPEPRWMSFRSCVTAVLSLAALLGAASLPTAMTGPGEWEVGKSATGGDIETCLADPAMLAQWEHRGRPCTRVILSDKGTEAIIHYTCPAGDFGRSSLSVITPRSLRIETQGIHSGEPFFYKLYARRVADC